MSSSIGVENEIVLSGIVSDFYETGMEGMEWVLIEDGKAGYESIVPLEDGDFLEIHTRDGEILFRDTIQKDFSATIAGHKSFRWIQSGVAVKQWLTFFLSQPSLPAKIHLKAYRNLTMPKVS